MQTLATAFFTPEESTFIELILRAEIKNDRAELRFDNPKKMNDALRSLEKYSPEVSVQRAEVSALSFSAADWTRMTAQFLGTQGNNNLATPAADIKPVDRLKAAYGKIRAALLAPVIDWKEDVFFSDKLSDWPLPANIVVIPWQPVAVMLNTCYPDAEGKHRLALPPLCKTAEEFATLPKNRPVQLLLKDREGRLFLVSERDAHHQQFEQVLSAFTENVASLFRLGLHDLRQGLCFGKDPATRNALSTLLTLCKESGLRELQDFQAEFIKLQHLMDTPFNSQFSEAAFTAQATACIKTFLARPMLNKTPPHTVLTQIYDKWGQALQQQIVQITSPETHKVSSTIDLMAPSCESIDTSLNSDRQHREDRKRHTSSKVLDLTGDETNQTQAINVAAEPVAEPSAARLNRETPARPLIHSKTQIDPTAQIHYTAKIKANVKIEKNVQVGANAIIGNGAILHNNSIIGEHTKIGSRTTIGTGSKIAQKISIPKDVHVASDVDLRQLTIPVRVKIPKQSIIKGNLSISRKVKFAGPIEFGNAVQIMPNLEFQSHLKLADFGIFRNFPPISNIPAEKWILCRGDLEIGKNVSIGTGVELGADVKIGDHVTLGDGVKLGAGTIIQDYCSLAADVTVGDNVRVSHSITIVGANVTEKGIVNPLSHEAGAPIFNANPTALKRIAPSPNIHDESVATDNSQPQAKRPRLHQIYMTNP